MPNLEQAIRERAYHLWLADGQPEGKAETYWLNAQHEILVTSAESTTNAVAGLDKVPTKPARRGRSAKGKTRAG
jgi:hypothetical protein